jgi:FG-GAP repeat
MNCARVLASIGYGGSGIFAFSSAATGDYNGDGATDILWRAKPSSHRMSAQTAFPRHQVDKSRGQRHCLSNRTALVTVFKLVEAAQRSWRRLETQLK